MEADLVSRGIITDAQAYKIDVTPAEASNLTTLEKAERDAAERLSLDLIRTDVEADLVSRGIITDAQAYKIDVTPAEASNLTTLEKAERDAAERLSLDLIRTPVEADLVSRGIITDAQAYKIDVTPAEASNLTTLEKAERDAAERLSLDLIRTPVEADLVSRGIITDAQAYKIDVTPAEASNLITLERAERAAINGLALGQVTYAEHLAAVQKYANALEAAVADVSVAAHAAAVQEYADALEAAVADVSVAAHAAAVQEYADALEAAVADVSVAAHAAAVQEYADALEAAVAESVELTATRDALEVLEDEQKRLDYRLAAARETLRVAQAARYVVGDSVEVTVSIDDPDVPDVPILVLRADGETIGEGGSATFTIETSVELVEDLDVFYVVEGSATADADFNAPDGDITMKMGQERITLSIPVRSDDDVEGDETLTVRLSVDPSAKYRLSDRDRATILIESSDLPELTLAGGGGVAEGDTAVVTIVADQPPDTDTSVNYQVSGSAQAGQDYVVVTGTALLRAGERSVTVEIRTINDDVVFMPETWWWLTGRSGWARCLSWRVTTCSAAPHCSTSPSRCSPSPCSPRRPTAPSWPRVSR